MKLFDTNQTRAWDAHTMEHEPIASVGLMNRAATAFADWFVSCWPDTERPVWVFAGTGNNGGDGVAVARLLHQRFYAPKVFVCAFGRKHSADFDAQVSALPPHGAVDVHWLRSPDELPAVPVSAVLVDALFGSGLTRPLDGPWAETVHWLNKLPNDIAAIDLPSGLFGDQRTPDDTVVHATRTFSFETPKRAFFFPENADRVGEWAFGSIGLHSGYAEKTDTLFHFITRADVQALVKKRPRFSHKGTYGHALLLNGSRGSMGAAVLAAEACLRAGAGLLTAHVPASGYDILQTRVPEAMCSTDTDEGHWTELPDLSRYSAIGAGCGIGQATQTARVLQRLLQKTAVPLVLDADALNLLATHPAWQARLPKNTVLTPHPKEFERLFGSSGNNFERNDLQRAKAAELGVFIILKGANTAIACPDGTCWFNSTGNPGMATGGSGDVLTGILTGLLAQGYPLRDACLIGVFLHGLAGDIAADEKSQPGLIAGDLVASLGMAWLAMTENRFGSETLTSGNRDPRE
ncbi:MAG: NAD(P)H-hydrate dehydratase [Saprospiraceae bacterium]